jgi:hypothetical protein
MTQFKCSCTWGVGPLDVTAKLNMLRVCKGLSLLGVHSKKGQVADAVTGSELCEGCTTEMCGIFSSGKLNNLTPSLKRF